MSCGNLNLFSDASIRLKMCVNESTFFFFLGYLFFDVQNMYGSILKCLFRAGYSFNASLLSQSFSVLAHRYISLPELSPLKKYFINKKKALHLAYCAVLWEKVYMANIHRKSVVKSAA